MVQTYETLDHAHTDMDTNIPTVLPRGRFIESNHIIGLQRAFSRATVLVVGRTVYGIRIRKAAVHEAFLSEALETSSDRFSDRHDVNIHLGSRHSSHWDPRRSGRTKYRYELSADFETTQLHIRRSD